MLNILLPELVTYGFRIGGTEDTIKQFKKYHPEGRLILVWR